MRRITRTSAPLELNESKESELTEKYMSDKQESVWNQTYIRDALLNMSEDKCAYCEAYLDEKSMYMEVEHFLPKSKYPDKVVSWNNLLPACKHCNASKGDHDPNEEPIINPSFHSPNEHLEIHNYRFLGVDTLGRTTVDVLNLNDYRNVLPRFKFGTVLMDTIEQVALALIAYQTERKIPARNRVLRVVRRILEECSSSSEYSIIVSTILAESPIFPSIRSQMKEHDIWSDDFEKDYQEACSTACIRKSNVDK